MPEVSSGASRGLRWGILSLVAAVALVGVTSDPADAARRRKKVAKPQHRAAAYNPPYASIVVDANTGAVLQSTQPDSLRHPASLTKVMTLYLLFERLEAGQIGLDSKMPVSSHAAAQAPSKLGLRPGQSLEVEDAIKALVTKSANDAAVVVAEALAGDEDTFARLMTRRARTLGMSRTVYTNANGLPDPDQVTTARDQALLGRAIQERFPRYYRYFSTASFTYRGRAMRNHNKLLGRVEGVDGIKTGYTRASGFNLLTSMRRGNRHIVAVVLGGRSGASRDAQMRELVGEYITVASARRTAPPVVEAAARAPIRVASAVPLPEPAPARAEAPRPDPAPTAALPAPRPATAPKAIAKPGSLEPIKPVAVRTVAVKAGTTDTAAFAAINVPIAQAPPSELKVAAPAEFPPRPAGARPGVLGVLPAAAAAPVVPAAVQAPPTPPASVPVSAPAPLAAAKPAPVRRGWIIQVGAFPDEQEAKERLNSAQVRAKKLLGDADPFTEAVNKGDKVLYRARFAGLEKAQAEAACRYLKRNDIVCMTLKN